MNAPSSNDPLQILRALFQRRKICDITIMTEILRCSARTVSRRLKQLKAINSYNHNNRFYTLSALASFDAHGIWSYRGVLFSSHGGLFETVIALVNDSKAGLNAAELKSILKIKDSSFLSYLRNHPSLRRIKRPSERYVYYSAQLERFAQQQQIEKMLLSAVMPTDAEAIEVLLEIIRDTPKDIEELCTRFSGKIGSDKIRNLLNHHGIVLKKTPIG